MNSAALVEGFDNRTKFCNMLFPDFLDTHQFKAPAGKNSSSWQKRNQKFYWRSTGGIGARRLRRFNVHTECASEYERMVPTNRGLKRRKRRAPILFNRIAA